MNDNIETPEDDDNIIDMAAAADEAAMKMEAAAKEAEDAVLEEGEAAPETEMTMADRLIAMEGEKAEIKDQLLRTMAELENVRKRAERQVADERVYAVEKFARDMLGVADNLSRALIALNDDARAELSDAGKSLLEGIELTEKELIATMARHGVTIIDSIPGTEFDPNVHQAVAQVPSEQDEGTVAEPFQTGWKIGERTLRAAMVAVSTGSE